MDGRRLTTSLDPSIGACGIWLIAAGGGSPRKLVDALPVSGLGWSRDVTAIVYAASAGSLIVGHFQATSDIVLLDQGATAIQ